MRNYTVLLFLFIASFNSVLKGQGSSAPVDYADEFLEYDAIYGNTAPYLYVKFENSYEDGGYDGPFFLSELSVQGQEIREAHVAFAQNSYFQKEYPGQFRYYAKGLHVSKMDGLGATTIIDNAVWSHELSDMIKFSIPVQAIIAEDNGGEVTVKFDSLFRIDSKGRKRWVQMDHGWKNTFELYQEKDPLQSKYAFPRVVLLVDGKKIVEGQRVPRDAKLTLSLEIYPKFTKAHPEECNYQLHRAKMGEKGCFGIEFKYFSSNKSSWGSPPVIEVPVKDLVVGFGGEYYVWVDCFYRKGANGRVYPIKPKEEIGSFKNNPRSAQFYLKYLP